MPRRLILAPHEQRFVAAIIEGKTQGEAYQIAKFPRRNGAKPVDNLVARKRAGEIIKGNRRVQDALARAQRNALDIKVEDIIAMLERAYDVALRVDPPQTGGAVSAAMGIARLLGLVIDRSEVNVTRNKPSPVPTQRLELDETQWRRLFDPSHNNRNDR